MGAFVSFLRYYTTTLTLRLHEKQTLAGTSCADRDPNATLANELRGMKLHVDMIKSFEHWPSGARHPEYEHLRRETDRVLEV